VFAAYTLNNIVWDKKLFITALIIIVAVIFISLTSVIIVSPFDHTRVYHYEPGRWSHVFIGRLISFLTLILFLILLNSKRRVVLLLIPAVTAGTILIYITGLRSAILGILLAGLTYLIYSIVKRRLLNYHHSALAAVIIFISILLFSTDCLMVAEVRTTVRIDNMLNYENFNFGGEEGLQIRVKSAELACEMFLNSPVIGNGYGSFKGYNNIKWASDQKYPHNIILEILAEFGIVGLFFFGYIFYSIIHSLFYLTNRLESVQAANFYFLSSRFSLLILFLFSFWLALFSKDLSTQSLIWIFLAVIGERKS
jgi:O-antigen ligase